MKFYNANGKEYRGTPWQGAYYDSTGKVRYTFKNGAMTDVATTDSFLAGISPYFAKYKSITKNKSNTTVNTGGKEYSVYSANGAYFYKSGKNYIPITDSSVVGALKKNNKTSISLDKPSPTNTNTNTNTNANTETKKEETTVTPPPQYTTGGGGTSPEILAKLDEQDRNIKDLTNTIYELQHPKVMSAEEAAKHFDIDYNYDNILRDYNDRTNKHYGDAIAEQEDLRTQYLRNNTQYYDAMIDNYVDTYANAAPTATGRGVLSANALTSQLNANRAIANNDYGMLQSVNNLEKARDAELAGNPYLAKQYYNNLGTYLSTLTANKNTYDVQQYIDQLDAYTDMYASARATQASLAQANAAKYSGLANASVYNAQNNANNATNNWYTLYNFYKNALGDDKLASKYVTNLSGSSFNAGTNK